MCIQNLQIFNEFPTWKAQGCSDGDDFTCKYCLPKAHRHITDTLSVKNTLHNQFPNT